MCITRNFGKDSTLMNRRWKVETGQTKGTVEKNSGKENKREWVDMGYHYLEP
uniref:Uncharacterized protein n=1 Tax=Arion vulgaris TaxID=1028688 RepID=A0A0B7BCR3_9EUPU